jgi:hypothetical protein
LAPFKVLLGVEALAKHPHDIRHGHFALSDRGVLPHLILFELTEIAKPQLLQLTHNVGLEAVAKKLAPDANSGEIDAQWF